MMVSDVTLDPGEAQRLRDLAAEIRAVRALLAKAKRAGLPTAALEQRVDQVESLRTGMLREFAPRPGAHP